MAKGMRRQPACPGPLQVDEAVSRARAALVGIGGFESAEVIRSQRDERGARIASSELRHVVREAPADLDFLIDLGDVRSADLGD
jgi:hypothetical protein